MSPLISFSGMYWKLFILRRNRINGDILGWTPSIITSYWAENGSYDEETFQQALKQANQYLDVCGVGANNQIGIVEHQKKQLTEWHLVQSEQSTKQ